MGDTDRTPDGGFPRGFSSTAVANIRKAAALHLSGAARSGAGNLHVDKSQLSVRTAWCREEEEGLVRRARAGQQLKLTIPVMGDLTNMSG